MLIDSAKLLSEALRSRLPKADETTVDVLTAVTGLLGAITHIDRKVRHRDKLSLSP